MKFKKGAIITEGKTKPPSTGWSKFFYVRINPSATKDVEPHEIAHVHQWYMMLALCLLASLAFYGTIYFQGALIALTGIGVVAHNGLYTLSKKYRCWSEVQAFKASIKNGRSLDSCARSLSKYYKLDITEAEAKKLLA